MLGGMHLKEERFSLASHSLKYQLLLSLLHAQLIISFLLRLSGAGGIDSPRARRRGAGKPPWSPQMHTATAGTSTTHPRKRLDLALPKKPRHDAERPGWELPALNTAAPIPKSPLLHVSSRLFPPGAPHSPPPMSLLYSVSFLLVVLSFLMISCFLDFTMAELLSVSLLKKAGG